MNNENKTIHDFDFNLICEFFSHMERQGPGSPDVTLKALSFIDNLTDESLIADIGCGTGGQTMTLARHIQGKITALDLFPDFINILNRNADRLGLQDRVKGIVGSMLEALPFEEESLDLIWSEGAIYNIGFERGIKEWRKYLKTGGYIAISEACWFTDERPQEIIDFWSIYPEINTISNKIAQVQKAGYLPVATFILPQSCWTEHYFAPKIIAQDIFLNKYAGNKSAEELVTSQHYEEELYHKYKEFYGYTFFIAQKVEL